MQSSPTVLRELNAVLREALTLINQYFLHARMAKNQGYDALNHKIYKQSIAEMKAADALVQRIFLLGGLPNLQDLGKLLIGEDMAEVIACDTQGEERKHAVLKQAISLCEQEQDFVSRHLLEELKEENEEYLDWLETQQGLMANLGLPNWLQTQIAAE
ncbi:MAG: bacterioferritin [Brachymonas sp.]